MAIGIGITFLVIIVALIAFVGTRPKTFRIERSGQVNASPETVFSLINDFHKWYRWSPWEKLDPEMKKTFEGASAGPGAVYAWTGNKKVGEGRMTLLESKVGEFVSVDLQFFRPFSARNQTIFRLTPSETGTHVVWRMDGNNNFMGKAFSLIMDMDKMVGKDFEEGLVNLNTAAQAAATGA